MRKKEARPSFVPKAWIAYMLLVLTIHGACALFEIKFSDIAAYITLAFLTDFVCNEKWKQEFSGSSERTEIGVVEKSFALAVREITPDHFTCKFGDLKKLEKGWHTFAREGGQIAGPFGSLQEAVINLAEANLH